MSAEREFISGEEAASDGVQVGSYNDRETTLDGARAVCKDFYAVREVYGQQQ